MYTLHLSIRILYFESSNVVVTFYGYSKNVTTAFNVLHCSCLHAHRSFLSRSGYSLFVYYNGFAEGVVLELKYCSVVENAGSGVCLNLSFSSCKSIFLST